MLKETGLVIKVENDIAWVNTQSKLACSSCQVESTCGNGILEKYLAGKVFISKIDNLLNAKVGDEVVISIPKTSVSKASLIVYGLPLLMLFIGAILGDIYFLSEIMSIFLGFVGLAVGIMMIKVFSRRIVNNQNYLPKMVFKISKSVDVSVFESIQIKNIS